jgi:hypothetical protein
MAEATIKKVCTECGRPVREDYQPPSPNFSIGYNAVSHDDGGDPLFCNPDDPNSTEASYDEPREVTTMAETIDLTPRGLETPEGVKRVNTQLDAMNNATSMVANAATEFFENHRVTLLEAARGATISADDCAALRDSLQRLEALIEARRREQDRLLRAVAGQPELPR